MTTQIEAILAVAKAIDGLAYHVKYLGNGNAATEMGAIKAFGLYMGERMSATVETMATAMCDGCADIATAINDHGRHDQVDMRHMRIAHGVLDNQEA